jgi:hypothetical protein
VQGCKCEYTLEQKAVGEAHLNQINAPKGSHQGVDREGHVGRSGELVQELHVKDTKGFILAMEAGTPRTRNMVTTAAHQDMRAGRMRDAAALATVVDAVIIVGCHIRG